MLKIENCRERQKRLLAAMEERKLDVVALANPKTVYYFTGALVDAAWPQVFALTAAGKSVLITNREPARHAAERLAVYAGYTLKKPFGRQTMNAETAELLAGFLKGAGGRAAIERESVNAGLAAAIPAPEDPVDITSLLTEMRRRKDPDEIECMRAAVRMTEAGYAAIKAALEPGITEFEAYRIIHDAMVNHAGTSVELKGDFAAGTRAINGGGAPTDRKVQPGDLYIFDLFPTVSGYMCDLCRTFAAGPASDLQREAWAHVMEAHQMVQRILRPGVRGCEAYHEIRAHLDRFEPARGSFTHHLGHGVGMDGWEYPWLTPGSDQEIREGEVIACEPGIYGEALQGGIRLEHNYLVGKDSVEPLDSFPMDL